MLATRRTCAHKMHLEYVERLPRGMDSFSLAFGSAMHATFAWWFRSQLSKQTPTRAELRNVFVNFLSLQLVDARFDSYDVKEFGTERFAREGLLRQGLRVCDLFLGTIATLFDPWAVEQSFCVSPGDRPWDLRGTPDLLGAMRAPCICCHKTLGAGVVDWKFSLSPSSYTDASHEEWVQGTCYTPAFTELYGRLPDFVALIKIKRTGRNGPSWSIYHSHRTPDDLQALWVELDALWHDMQYDIHPATGLGSPLCTRQWCAYYARCEPRLSEERRFLETSGI